MRLGRSECLQGKLEVGCVNEWGELASHLTLYYTPEGGRNE